MGYSKVRLVGCLLFFKVSLCLGGNEYSSNYYKYLTTSDGLPQNTVNAIVKDPAGFMWIGTDNGLCKYDGYTFTPFTHSEIHFGIIRTLAVAKDYKIWVGTNKRVYNIDICNDSVTVFDEIYPLSNDCEITQLFVDNENTVWIGTLGNGIIKVSETTNNTEISHYKFNELFEGTKVGCIYQTSNQKILVGTDKGLFYFQEGDNNFKKWNIDIPQFTVNSILETKNGDLWIGTYWGLAKVDKNTGNAIWYLPDPNNPESIQHATINAIKQDVNGTIYIGTLGGVDILKPGADGFLHSNESGQTPYCLSSNFVKTVYCDDDGIIWFGTEKGGINLIDIYQKPFYFMKHDDKIPSVSNNTINSIFVENDDLWIGTAGGGLNKYDKKTEQFTYYQKQLSNSFVSAIAKDLSGTIWAGTWGGGITRIDKQQQVSYLNKPIEGLASSFISSLHLIADRFMLIGTVDGISCYDTQNNQFIDLSKVFIGIENLRNISSIATNTKNQVWIATNKGVVSIDFSIILKKASSFSYDHSVDVEVIDSVRYINRLHAISVYCDYQNTFWVGTYGNGLYHFTPHKKDGFVFKNYTTKDGLCNNVIYAIVQDDVGNLWLSTDLGLSCFNTSLKHFSNYYKEDGLLSDQFYWSASGKSENGQLFFGSVEGLVYFYPSLFSGKRKQLSPTFTNFKVFNQEVDINKSYHGTSILTQKIEYTDTVFLSYQDRIFTIEFSALEYFNPEKIEYQYKLQGIDRDWVTVDAGQRLASYSKLNGGTYDFRLRISDKNDHFSDFERRLIIIIKPPFWKTWWFRILLLIVLGSTVVLFYYFKNKRLIHRNMQLEYLVKKRTQKIKDQSLELQANYEGLEARQEKIEGHKISLEKKNAKIVEQRDHLINLNQEVNRINNARLQFFTNISHEFRTPLSLIIPPIQELTDDLSLEEQTHNKLQVVNRNAKRLNILVDQLLTFRKIETNNLKTEYQYGNFNEFITGVFRAFKILAQEKYIDYHLYNSLPDTVIQFDVNLTENVLYNLLSNAFKFTPKGKSVDVYVDLVSSETDEKVIQICVDDKGIGISYDDQRYIFDRFYRGSNQHNTKGSGIGLSLTADIVKLLGGTIACRSKLHQGSRFTIQIPYLVGGVMKQQGVKEVAFYDFDKQLDKIELLLQEEKVSEIHKTDNTSNTNKPFVLLCEDNVELLGYLTSQLQDGYNLLTATNGEEGLSMALKHNPDLILSDVMMPKMDGVQLCKKIREHIDTSHIPFIFLSAKSLIEHQLEGLQSGADDYLTKPFSNELLRLKIDKAIENRQRIRQKIADSNELEITDITISAIDKEFLGQAYAILDVNYKESNFSVEEFSSSLNICYSLLYKKLKAITDMSPNDFIRNYRLKKSIELFKETSMNINEVAYAVGFNDPKYFSRIFKKKHKQTPSQYIAALKSI